MRLRAYSILIALLLPLPAVAQTRPASPTTQPVQFADASRTARALSTVAVLNALRNATDLYALQHGGKVLSYADVADWAILLHATDNTSHPNPSGEKRVVGPYLREVPVNALTDHSKLCEFGRVTADAGWIWDARGQDSLILIALPDQGEPLADYLVACNVAVKCPEIRVAQRPASVGWAAGIAFFAAKHPEILKALNANLRLQIIQSHLALAYRQPDAFTGTLRKLRDWRMLLGTAGQGPVIPGQPTRPSLPHPLGNPFRNDATRIVAAGTAKDDPDAGWTFSPKTGELRVVVPADVPASPGLREESIERVPAEETAPEQSFP